MIKRGSSRGAADWSADADSLMMVVSSLSSDSKTTIGLEHPKRRLESRVKWLTQKKVHRRRHMLTVDFLLAIHGLYRKMMWMLASEWQREAGRPPPQAFQVRIVQAIRKSERQLGELSVQTQMIAFRGGGEVLVGNQTRVSARGH
jgi:hypothetical protein